MKKLMIVLMVLVGVFASVQAGSMMSQGSDIKKVKMMPKNYRTVPFAKAEILQSGPDRLYCAKCGMTLPMFYRTNHAARVDGKMEQFCSMYCLVEEMNSGKKLTDIQVVDNATLKFIPVSKAFYVVGSSKPATMAKKVSKYAFGTKADAEKFAKQFGGRVMNYDEALAIAKKDFADDTAAKKMRQAKGAGKGAMIYKKKCKPIEKNFKKVAEAKAYIKANHICGDLKGKPLQAVGLYLVSGQNNRLKP